MKSTHTLNFVKFAACMVLVVGLSASALASCGDTLSAMAAAAASVQSQFRPIQPNSKSGEDNDGKSAIVGSSRSRMTSCFAIYQPCFVAGAAQEKRYKNVT